MTDTELKDRCEKIIYDHLETCGFPDMTDAEILSQLKPIWLEFEKHDLTDHLRTRGGDFKSFVELANKTIKFVQIRDAFDKFIKSNKPFVKPKSGENK